MPSGRPPKKMLFWLEPENLIRIEGWARDGLTEAQIAEKMEVSLNSIWQWKKKSEEFSNALKNGKDVVDRKVENSLLKRALGYEYEETTKEVFEIPSGTNGEKQKRTHIKTTTKFVPPDVTAQIFWLKNRKPAEWRDKQVIESTANGMLADLIDGLKEPVEEPEKE